MRLVPVFILETHNPDELQNVCPGSSRRIMRPLYKNGHYPSGRTLAETFVVRLVMRLKYKDGHLKTHYAPGRTFDSFEISLERRSSKGSSSGRITRLVPVFILETHNLQNV